jgi:D-alanyl-D-alanine carboxypeptidase (penicillin-binding protein 5/6)
MLKKTICIFILSVFLCFNIIVSADMTLESSSAILVDAKTKTVLYAKDENLVSIPASVTKIMTMLLVLKAVDEGKITLQDEVTISEYASKMGGTQLYIEPGEKRKVDELMYGVAVESANDAATALGEYVAGSNDNFVKMMNEEAMSLNMKNTVFKNANGLPEDGHVTTAYDIALMSCELVKYEKIFEYTKTWMIDIKVGLNNDKNRTLANTNKLLKRDSAVDGLKTGYTTEAMYCMSCTKKQGEMRLISVVMHAPSSEVRFNEALQLLNYGFSNYIGKCYVEKDEKIGDVIVNKGKDVTVEAVADSEIYNVIEKGGEEEADIVITLEEKINAPVSKGDVLGTVIAKKNNTEIGQCNLIAKNNVDKLNIFHYVIRNIHNFFSCNQNLAYSE